MDSLIPSPGTSWSDRLAFDMALLLEHSGDTLPDLMKRHSLKPADLVALKADPTFVRQIDHYRGEIRDNGVTFKLKARTQAEELLITSWDLIHAPDVSPAVKADLIKSTVKWAGLEPKGDQPMADGSGGVRITINLAGQDPRGGAGVDAKVVEG